MRHTQVECPECQSKSVSPFGVAEVYECFGCGEVFEAEDFSLQERRRKYDRQQEEDEIHPH